MIHFQESDVITLSVFHHLFNIVHVKCEILEEIHRDFYLCRDLKRKFPSRCLNDHFNKFGETQNDDSLLTDPKALGIYFNIFYFLISNPFKHFSLDFFFSVFN